MLSRYFKREKLSDKTQTPKNRRLLMERLETRALLSVTPLDANSPLDESTIVATLASAEPAPALDLSALTALETSTTEKTTLAAPILSVAALDSSSLTVSIEGVENASGYALEYSSSSDFTVSTTQTLANAGTCALNDLTAHTTYYVRVKSLGTGDYVDSAWSPVASATTEKIALTSVEINGNPKVGTTLTTNLFPNGANVTWRWYRGTSATDVTTAISGAVSSSYVPTVADVGCYLKVVATGVGAYAGEVACVTSTATLSLETPSLTVTISSDVVDRWDGEISLREAIQYAEANPTLGDAIVFAESLKGQTITLSGTQLEIKQGIKIDASAVCDATTQAPGITIDANRLSRVFQLSGGTATKPIELVGLAITGGKASGRANLGGGVYVADFATFTNCSISGNVASASGGGLYAYFGTTTFTNCSISGNVASASGGGLYALNGKTTLTNCSISGNTASYSGGGVYAPGGKTVLTNCTAAGNGADYYGGVYAGANATTTLRNTIVASNFAAKADADFSGALATDGGANLIGFDPKFVVGPVFDANGKLTNADALDLRLSPESWAVDRGDNAYVAGVATDLAGAPRTVASWRASATVDVGAYERQETATKTPETPSLVVTTLRDVVDDADGEISLREALLYAEADANLGDSIAFAAALKGGTITLNGSELLITQSVKIDASALRDAETGAPGLAVDANKLSRVFYATGGSTEKPIEFVGLTITGGKADGFGGGLYVALNGAVALANCVVSGNTSTSSGGGVYVASNGAATFANCSVRDNTAAYDGGGVYAYYATTAFANCLVGDNTAASGGGVYEYYGTATLTNCSISGNAATVDGGGLYVYAGTATLSNAIVALNAAVEGDVDVCDAGSAAKVVAFNVLASYSAWDNASADGVANYVYDETRSLFTDAANGDYSLANDSQAIDKGDDARAVDAEGNPLTIDLTGGARFVGAVDLGAYERQILVPAAPTNAAFDEFIVASASATLTWDDNADNETGYVVERRSGDAWELVAMLDADATAFTASGLELGTTYVYRVYAFNEDSASEPISAMLTTPTPETPSLIVTTSLDVVDNLDYAISLREAVLYAAADATLGSTITFDANLKGATITLSGSQIEIGQGVAIDASALYDAENGVPGVTVDADGKSRVFNVSGGTKEDPVELVGLKFVGGYVSDGGAAIRMGDGELRVVDCAFCDNQAASGGAIQVAGVATTSVSGSTFDGNAAQTSGGAISVSNEASVLTVVDSTFANNDATEAEGGGIASNGAATISGSAFVGNNAGASGGAIIVYRQLAEISDCYFETNSAYNSGGGIWIGSSGTIADCAFVDGFANDSGAGIFANANASPTVTNCDFSGNVANDCGAGFFASTSATLIDCRVSGNVAGSKNGQQGGGVYLNSGTMTNCVVTDNSALQGGGVFVKSSGILTNCVVANNAATYGGGVYVDGASTLTNSLIVGNLATYDGGGVYVKQTATLVDGAIVDNRAFRYGGGFLACVNSTSTLCNAIVVQNRAHTGADVRKTTGVVDANAVLSGFGDWNNANADGVENYVYDASLPLFTDAENGDYTLAAGSQALNKGIDAYAVDAQGNPLTTDLAGNARFVGTVDLGPYEYQVPAPAAPTDAAFDAFVVASASAELTWVDNADDETGYAVERWSDGVWELVATLDADATSFVASGLEFGTVYEYRVYAFNEAGASEPISATLTTPTLETPSLVVTTNLDVVDATDGEISLREAILYAAADATLGSTITFDANLKGATITLSGSQIEIGQGVAIDASALYDAENDVPGVTVDADGKSRVFYVKGGTEETPVAFVGLTITGGSVQNSYGGGVYVEGVASFTSCSIIGNAASAELGADGFYLGGEGGGVYVGGVATLTACVVADNTAELFGGGVFAYGTAALTNVLIADNSSNHHGGGFYAYGKSTLTNCSITGNSAALAGGLGPNSRSTTTLYNTIVAQNAAEVAPDLHTTSGIVYAYNVLSSYSEWDGGANNYVYDASLPLFTDAENGDYTLAAGSQALNKGIDAYVVDAQGNPLTTDLAGNARFVETVDLGPYERQIQIPAAPTDAAFDAFVVASASAELTWVDNADDETGYAVERWSDGVWELVATLDADATSFVASGLEFGTVYKYRVYAFNEAGASEPISATLTTPTLETPLLVVTTNLDVVDATDGEISLREAILYAAADATLGSTITFDANLKGATITLSGSQIEIGQGVAIDASALYDATTQTSGIAIDADGKSRVFYVKGGTEETPVAFVGLTITGGSVQNSYGGGVYVYGAATFTNCVVSGNAAEYDGGGVYVYGSTTFTNCVVCGNTAEYDGGGVYVSSGSTTFTNCSVSGNTASYGGGVYVSTGSTALRNSIVALNYGGDAEGAFDGESANNLIGFDPRFVVGPVFDSEGKLTNAESLDLRLTEASWAIDRGSNEYLADGATDLAGNPRTKRAWAASETVDLGAYEYQATFEKTPETPSTVVTVGSDAVDDADGEISLREAILYAEADAALGTTITFAPSLKGQTIALKGAELYIRKSVAIDASSIYDATSETPGIAIDGDQKSRVVQIYADSLETPVAFIGLTITGGKTNGFGGGVYARGATAFTNCVISDNASSSGGGVWTNAETTLTNCVVSNNAASYGGGVFTSGSVDATFTNCSITENTAANDGGGVFLGGATTLANCVVSGNEARLGGGVCLNFYSETKFANTSINGNKAGNGGGLFASNNSTLECANTSINGNEAGNGGGLSIQGDATFTNCSITENTASYYGGGVYVSAATTFTNCAINGNKAENGGGVYVSAATTFTNCAITENAAAIDGGGVYVFAATTFTNCTIAGNAATAGSGGGVYMADSAAVDTSLYNTVVALNVAAASDADIGYVNLYGEPLLKAYNALSSFTAWDNANETGVVNYPYNASLPLFKDAANGDYALALGSQAIDKGNDEYAVDAEGVSLETDLLGKARVYGARVDLGAYEFHLVVTTNRDVVDANDGVLSLREAIQAAQNGDTIVFDASLKGQTITLSGTRLQVAQRVKIDASALYDATKNAPGLTVDANEASRVFEVSGGTAANPVELIGLTITGGNNGGVYVSGAATFTNCAITGNAATYGGGAYVSGAATFTNCAITGNAATNGGGAYVYGAATFTNCTIAGNSAEIAGGLGHFSKSTTTLYNTIVAQNTAQTSSDVHPTTGSKIYAYNALSSFKAWNSGSNNYVYNASLPLFKNAANGDYTLAKNSQALDKGNDSYISGYATDLAGKTRVCGSAVDLGAYETPDSSLPTAPSNVAFGDYDASTKTATLTWRDNASNETRYEIRYSIDGGEWARMADLPANATSRLCGGLGVNKTYEFQIRAVNSLGASEWIGATLAVPAAPTNVKFGEYDASAKTATLTWKDNATNEARYEVRFSVDGEEWSSPKHVDANATSRLCGGLGLNKNYEFQVRAVSSSGHASAWVGTTLATPPAAPTNVTFGAYDASAKTATLTWNDNAANETRYEVRYSVDGGEWAQMADLPANATSRLCGGLGLNKTYEFQVRAVNATGASAWVGATLAVPSAPTDVKFEEYDASAKTATLTWNDNAANEVRYEVRYAIDGGEWRSLADLDANSTSRLCGGLGNNRTYEFQIRAVSASGHASAWNGATLATLPAAPTNVTFGAYDASTKTATLTWNDNAANETRYEIRRLVEGGEWSSPENVDANATSRLCAGLEVNQTYEFQIRAVNASGASDWVGATFAVPAAPTDAKFGEYDPVAKTATLTWTDNATNEVRYEARYAIDGGEWTTPREVPANATSRLCGGLGSNKSYEFQIRAVSAVGLASDWVGATIAIPAAPTNVKFGPYDDLAKTATLTWTDNATNEVRYETRYSVDGGEWSSPKSVDANATSRLCGGLGFNKTYVFQVRAVSATGAVSVWVGATIVPAPIVPAAPTNVKFGEYDPVAKTATLTWRDNATNEIRYETRYSVDGGEWSSPRSVDANSTSRLCGGLGLNKTYVFQVRAVSAIGVASDWVDATLDTAPPVPPTNVTFGEYDAVAKTATLTWTDNATNEARYEIRYSVDGGEWTALSDLDANSTSRLCGGLGLNKTYAFQVRAVSTAGLASDWVGATLAVPATPTNVKFGEYDAVAKTATLTWTDNAANEAKYEVRYRVDGGAWKAMKDLDANATSRLCGGLGVNKTYEFQIRAVSATGHVSAWAGATLDVAPPAAPTNVKFGEYDPIAKAATLTWTDNATNEARYEVRYSVDGGAWKTMANLSANTTSRLCGGLGVNKTYVFQIRAVTIGGLASAWVGDTIAPQPAIPAAPTNVKFGEYDAVAKTATLTWTDNATNEARYEVRYSVDGGAWKTMANLSANTTSRLCGGLGVNKTYEFQIRAVNSAGGASDWVGDTIAPRPAAPTAPTNVKFGEFDPIAKTATLTWTDNATNEVRYELRFRVDGGAWGSIKTLDANSTSRLCGGLGVNKTYEYQIRAVDALGSASDWVGATLAVPAAPTNVKFGAYDSVAKTATLTWTDNATNEVRYEVRYRVGGGAWGSMKDLAANATSRLCGGLGLNKTYEFQIRAVSTTGCASAWVGATLTTSAASAASEAISTSSLATEIFANPFDEFDFFEEEWRFEF